MTLAELQAVLVALRRGEVTLADARAAYQRWMRGA